MNTMKVRMIKISAEWCPPCKAMAKEIELLKEEKPDWEILQLDAEDGGIGQEFAEEHNVTAFPTTFFEVDGKVKVQVGFMTKDQIIKFVEGG